MDFNSPCSSKTPACLPTESVFNLKCQSDLMNIVQRFIFGSNSISGISFASTGAGAHCSHPQAATHAKPSRTLTASNLLPQLFSSKIATITFTVSVKQSSLTFSRLSLPSRAALKTTFLNSRPVAAISSIPPHLLLKSLKAPHSVLSYANLCEASSLNGCITPHSNGSLGVCAFGHFGGWTGVTAELLGAEHLTGPLATLTRIGRNPERQQQLLQGRPVDGASCQAARPDWTRGLERATEWAFPSKAALSGRNRHCKAALSQYTIYARRLLFGCFKARTHILRLYLIGENANVNNLQKICNTFYKHKGRGALIPSFAQPFGPLNKLQKLIDLLREGFFVIWKVGGPIF